MDNFFEQRRRKKAYDKTREDYYKEQSKERLLKIVEKKLRTTMIGSLATFEKYFGFLWGQGQEEPLTPEQMEMKKLYEGARSEVLDNGNNQIRNVRSEVSQYEIKWNRFQVTLPVKSISSKEQEDG